MPKVKKRKPADHTPTTRKGRKQGLTEDQKIAKIFAAKLKEGHNFGICLGRDDKGCGFSSRTWVYAKLVLEETGELIIVPTGTSTPPKFR